MLIMTQDRSAKVLFTVQHKHVSFTIKPLYKQEIKLIYSTTIINDLE